ncbi:MAG: hypothetical protein GKR91_04775 [Pseudomonadales bacterium]|nr:hypothetical protein [Pseudomonadales bacterium]
MGIEIGSLCVRRCAQINAPAQRIWEEFESIEKLSAWYGIGHKIESFQPGLDGEISMSVEIEGRRRPYGGKIIVWEPGAEFSIDDNWYDEDMAWPVNTFITIRLSEYNGETLVELFHHGFERLGSDAATQHEGYEAGWKNQHLMALKKIVEGS